MTNRLIVTVRVEKKIRYFRNKKKILLSQNYEQFSSFTIFNKAAI